MKAFWRGKYQGTNGVRWSLWDATTRKEIKSLGGYNAWDNARSESASEGIELAIEKEAQQLGYEIVENPID